jgi:hypothetical protein
MQKCSFVVCIDNIVVFTREFDFDVHISSRKLDLWQSLNNAILAGFLISFVTTSLPSCHGYPLLTVVLYGRLVRNRISCINIDAIMPPFLVMVAVIDPMYLMSKFKPCVMFIVLFCLFNLMTNSLLTNEDNLSSQQRNFSNQFKLRVSDKVYRVWSSWSSPMFLCV